jgi:hypothetical protein
MPAIFAFILGVVVTIAGAYAYDTSTGRVSNGLPTTAAAGRAPMVNWDVVTEDWHTFTTSVQNTATDLENRWKRHTG